MSPRRRSRPAQRVLAALLLTSGAQAGPPEVTIPTEADATPIVSGRTVAVVQSEANLGWFSLSLDQDAVVALRATRLPPDTSLLVYQTGGSVRCRGRRLADTVLAVSVRQFGATRYADVCGRPGTVFVALRSEADAIGGAPPVEFTVHPYEPGEDDADFDQARRVTLGVSERVQFIPQGDVDTFRMEAAQSGVLHLDLLGWPAREADSEVPFIEWYRADGTFLQSETPTLAVEAGTWFVRLAASRDHRRPVHTPFAVRFSLTPADAPGEPDATLEQAARAALGERIRRTFVPAGDVDSFRLELPSAGVLDVVTDPPSALSTAIYTAQQHRVAGTLPHFLDAGTWYVRLAPDDEAVTELQLTFELTPLRTYAASDRGGKTVHTWTFPIRRGP